jgi:hypothetical protein
MQPSHPPNPPTQKQKAPYPKQDQFSVNMIKIYMQTPQCKQSHGPGPNKGLF